MDNILLVFLVVFGIGFFISHAVRLYFWVRNRRDHDEFMSIVASQMTVLQGEIQQRAGDLQDTFDVVNREYSHLIEENLHVPPQTVSHPVRPARAEEVDD